MKNERNRLGVVVCAAALVLLGAVTARGQGPSFAPGCTLPFADIATTPDPFVACGNCGVVSGKPTAKPEAKAAQAAENGAKNNLCGDLAKKTVVDFTILANMQAATPAIVPSDRHTLREFFTVGGQKIGEGNVVRLKAFVREAHISDCDGGETVNCKMTGPASNDIHIPLADPAVPDSRTADECNSVTAEMTPHFRPATWAQIDMKTPVNNPVRITGQLFYDNSHHPCVKNADGTFKKELPARISLWEVHPVYQFEVCSESDASKCDIANDSVWVPYDKWVGDASNVTEATGRDFRRRCKKLNGTPSKPGTPTEPGLCPTPAPVKASDSSKPAKHKPPKKPST